jgi:hypothetical protein
MVPNAIPSRSTKIPRVPSDTESCILPLVVDITRGESTGVIEDMMKAFDRIPGMKEIQSTSGKGEST